MTRLNVLGLALSFSLMACSSHNATQIAIAGKGPFSPMVPDAQGPALSPSDVRPQQSLPVTLTNGAQVLVKNINGQLVFKVEGTFSEDSFNQLLVNTRTLSAADRKTAILSEMKSILGTLTNSGHAVTLRQLPEVGYFSFYLPYHPDMLAAVKGLSFKHQITITPSVFDPSALSRAKAYGPATMGLNAQTAGTPAPSAAGFSGLERIGAPAFVQKAETDIGGGVKVDGSSVFLGITDTGITYNHPTFKSGDGSNRIMYLRDFSGEGRAYFNPAAHKSVMEVVGSASELVVNTQALISTRLPKVPAADGFQDINNYHIQVSPALKALLLDPASKAMFGFVMEDAYQSVGAEPEQVDINANGKLDDRLGLIYVPGATPDQDVVYFDPNGTGDFTHSQPLAAFNVNHDTVEVFSERFGFDLRADDELTLTDGSGTVPVYSASIVGFDAGNHGSHVAGIAAGHKTISNDSDDTLARGVAPEAKILVDRICANNGGCNETEAVIDLATHTQAQVINLSIGSLSPFNDGYSVAETIINRLTSQYNILFSISAGNSGPGRQTVGSPSTARLAMSVAASASKGMIASQYQWPATATSLTADPTDDFLLYFSSRGPSAAGGFKPMITAPGTELSSVRLNNLAGNRGGLDIYWGTSMAAPTVTGAYALFVDAIQKYNIVNPTRKLTTDAVILRGVLLESARAFDATTFDPETGTKTVGQYTWIDQGKGIVNLPAAWDRVIALRDAAIPTAVNLAGAPVELDYSVLTAIKGPNGIIYDGSRPFVDDLSGAHSSPTLGTGFYLDYYGHETLISAYIARRLPARLTGDPAAGDLSTQLLTTQDEFVLKTTIYGSDKNWIRVGVPNGLDCANAPTSNLRILGSGAEVTTKPDGTGSISQSTASVLSMCLDRQMISHGLPAGDNGAIISGYRVVNGKVSPVASFMVPVYVTVPHQKLVGSNAYDITGTVGSFGVTRNYVYVPTGTTMVHIELSVPPVKVDADGNVLSSEHCSSVELMPLFGTNTGGLPAGVDSLVGNCTNKGVPITDPAKLLFKIDLSNPTPGMWDLHVFGEYKFPTSLYRMRVDYVTAQPSIQSIQGPVSSLNGSLTWHVSEASGPVTLDAAQSAFKLHGLYSETASQVAQGQDVDVAGPQGMFRAYAADVTGVTITTGQSTGNDIDLKVLGCTAPAAGAAVDLTTCAPVAASGTATDVESATFKPQAGKVYEAVVTGYAIKVNGGKFVSSETILTPDEAGILAITGSMPDFTVNYSFDPAQLAQSRLLNDPLFTSGKCDVVGDLILRTPTGADLSSIAIRIKNP